MSQNGQYIRISVIGGTRPEAIKLAPVIRDLHDHPAFRCRVVSTAQQDTLFCRTLREFDLAADRRLDAFAENAEIGARFSLMLSAIETELQSHRPDRILVQGDTMSTLAGAMAGYFSGIPVAHVEAGLRSGNAESPWPEEANRRSVACYADLHFAPTRPAAANLENEGICADRIAVTGNTGVDALFWARDRLSWHEDDAPYPPATEGPFILATAHRKEARHRRHHEMVAGLATAARELGCPVVFVLHPNPDITCHILGAGSDLPELVFLEPQSYLSFVRLLQQAELIVTDSGGVQEDATSLGRKVLVVREQNERMEGLGGRGRCQVTPERAAVMAAAVRLMTSTTGPLRTDFFGDGRAAARIRSRLEAHHHGRASPDAGTDQRHLSFS